MSHYTIADLARISGIKAHTIRMWEQRYNALNPKRTPGNTRYYNDRQLRKLLNVVSLSESGHKISELFALTEPQLNALLQDQIEKSRTADTPFEFYISQLLLAGMNYDEAGFDKHFSVCLLRYGIQTTYKEVLCPMLVRVGLLWSKDDLNPAQEHFLSNLVRQKLLSAIDGLPYPANSKSLWLLFLPEGEYHDTGLVFTNYLIRLSGGKTVYLGSNVPLESVRNAILDLKPAHVYLFMIRNVPVNETQSYLKDLQKVSNNARIHLSGNGKLIRQLKPVKNMDWIQTVDDLQTRLR